MGDLRLMAAEQKQRIDAAESSMSSLFNSNITRDQQGVLSREEHVVFEVDLWNEDKWTMKWSFDCWQHRHLFLCEVKGWLAGLWTLSLAFTLLFTVIYASWRSQNSHVDVSMFRTAFNVFRLRLSSKVISGFATMTIGSSPKTVDLGLTCCMSSNLSLVSSLHILWRSTVKCHGLFHHMQGGWRSMIEHWSWLASKNLYKINVQWPTSLTKPMSIASPWNRSPQQISGKHPHRFSLKFACFLWVTRSMAFAPCQGVSRVWQLCYISATIANQSTNPPTQQTCILNYALTKIEQYIDVYSWSMHINANN